MCCGTRTKLRGLKWKGSGGITNWFRKFLSKRATVPQALLPLFCILEKLEPSHALMLNSMEGKTSYFIQLLVTSCWIPWKAWRCIVRSNIWWCRIGRQCHRDQADQTRWCHASSSKWRCGLYLDVFLFLYSMFRFQDLSIGQCSQWSVVGCLFRGLKQSLPMETLVLSSKFWLLPSLHLLVFNLYDCMSFQENPTEVSRMYYVHVFMWQCCVHHLHFD